MRTGLVRAGPRRAGGWTVVELMMALGVLAVLLGLALPAYQSHRNKALSKRAAQDIVMMSAAIEAYWTDNRAYPASLADVGFGGRQDPWGRAYAYHNVDALGRGRARKDRALNPINTDFDLYSVGADGQTHGQVSHRRSADDVLRANNGRFIGLGAEF
jgi:general secretion pathway protein G